MNNGKFSQRQSTIFTTADALENLKEFLNKEELVFNNVICYYSKFNERRNSKTVFRNKEISVRIAFAKNNNKAKQKV